MREQTFTPENGLTQEQITQVRKALTHTYGKDYGILLFNQLIVSLN